MLAVFFGFFAATDITNHNRTCVDSSYSNGTQQATAQNQGMYYTQ